MYLAGHRNGVPESLSATVSSELRGYVKCTTVQWSMPSSTGGPPRRPASPIVMGAAPHVCRTIQVDRSGIQLLH